MSTIQLHHQQKKQPSETLVKLTEDCITQFGKLNISVNKALEQGRLEGFTDMEIGDMIRHKLLAAGYSKMTVSRSLPLSCKHMEKSTKEGNKMLPNPSQKQQQQLKFTAQIVTKGPNREVINLPVSIHPQLEGKKEVIVSLTLI
jgi:hypothetical protein